MTEVFLCVAQSLFGKATYLSMPDAPDHEWRYHQFHQQQMPMLTSQWAHEQGSQMGGMQDVDLRMFERDSHPYGDPFSSGTGHIMSPGMGYYTEQSAPPEMDITTPSTTGFAPEVPEGYQASNHSNSYLRPPTCHGHGSVSTQSPRSAQSETIPGDSQRLIEDKLDTKERPTISRSITAPEPRNPLGHLKRQGTSEDGDDEYLPVEEVKGRGRKRQRIPHTAVERRYRENLNAHLEKLRQTVPTLASGAAPGPKQGDAVHEGVKPSKCEILNGAIEHIGAQDKEIEALRDQVKLLRSQVNERDTWYRNHSRC